MVEVLMVGVKTADFHRQIIAVRVALRESIHHPVLARHVDLHVAGERDIMYREVEEGIALGAVAHFEYESHVLVVVHFAALHFECLLEGLAGFHKELYALRERRSVDIQFGTVRVGLVGEGKVEEHTASCPAVGYLACVAQFDGEFRTLVGQHIGLLVGIDAHSGFGKEHGGVVERCTRVVELGLILVLVRTVGGTRLGEEDITAVFLIIVHSVCGQCADRGIGSGIPY